ncbi:dual specificity protein phosphatase PPS1 [Dothidotthia symphoricarpi CBS 119687]|uniref:Dual specificity protein phosphatase PPS1 n=1 Tax=Dothidotthia symphoricarpi CBS 119687 TaxID=1392245 RepID=A0A6A6AEI2_9PLEO|nr:dual specificity protein phosphatase PPS1 [Dothidotthia symphoricarpi CBS 119687]KAF2129515.1 dual specificity protein phosphatase PPS1 [Dothidotthia symphoricarpi CBS 119687]
MAAAVARAPNMPSRSSTPPPYLSLNISSRGTPAAIPNKHIPICSPGGLPATPPASPPRHDSLIETSSITYPPDTHCTEYSSDPPVYTITADKMAEALEHMATQPLPHPEQVFPWLHGLHPENQIQLAFFTSRRASSRKIPSCLRSIALVKTGGNLSSSKLKAAISPEELLSPSSDDDSPAFIECDPKDGFSVRNFQIQTCKMAMVSDIIIYGDHKTHPNDTIALAQKISKAQRLHEAKNGFPRGLFNTFMLSDSFDFVQEKFPDLVAIDSRGGTTGNSVDFAYWERYEMCAMSKASEISNNVFLGPTPDPAVHPDSLNADAYDMLIEATDLAHVPESRSLRALRNALERTGRKSALHMEFPSSGSILPPTWSHGDVDGLMDTCKWMYELANPHEVRRTKRRRSDDDEAIELDDVPVPRKFLIHCTDGYTETTLLALAYFMYAEGLPAHDAWIQMHRDKGRNFFAYPTDVALLTTIQPRILQESPRFKQSVYHLSEPRWMSKIDGSLPSRILPYMYLGNLNHANNPEVLRELGITRILSVGEALSWPEDVRKKLNWPSENFYMVDRVQDNGVDPLWDEFERCLKFIEAGKADGGATLVHCRVGVSRSATICIAEVMKELGLSFHRAYCFVRARRLNVIIQPHLRFTYELLKWEEYQRQRRDEPLRRELEWATVAREIALMNKPYSR